MSDMRVERPNLLRDQVTETLRQAVLSGRFAPGERLTERELGELTGVSRTSLREGLRQLQSEGLVEPAPSRGLRVSVLSEAELADHYEVREYLEAAAVELFVSRSTDEQVGTLTSSLQQAVEADGESSDLRSSYYECLLDGAGNPLLSRLYASVSMRIVMMQRLSFRSPGRAEESQREAEEVIAAIESRDRERAVAAARHHVRMAKESALRALREVSSTAVKTPDLGR